MNEFGAIRWASIFPPITPLHHLNVYAESVTMNGSWTTVESRNVSHFHKQTSSPARSAEIDQRTTMARYYVASRR